MGYRSDVMALIYPEACRDGDEEFARYDQLKVLMSTTFKALVDDDFGACMTWMDRDRVLKFDIPDVKWYSGSSYVRRFEEMLSSFSSDDPDEGGIPGYCTEFIRIGEDTNDVEEDHRGENNQYYLTVRRSIDCNV